MELPDRCVVALRQHRKEQVEARVQAGSSRVDQDLVFSTGLGTALDAANVRRSFRAVVARAGLDGPGWTPRELRTHTVLFPEMAKWLPEEEGEQLLMDFMLEIERLKKAA